MIATLARKERGARWSRFLIQERSTTGRVKIAIAALLEISTQNASWKT